ncbi:hypothetical protein F5879DRAFT_1025574, partial [Lentinula edodes]
MWELSRCNISLKKLRCIAKECCPFKCAAYVAAIGQYTPDQFGFIDETSKDDRTPGQRQGRAKKGQRASTKQPFVRRKRLTVTGLLTQDGMMASRVVEGSMTHEMFCSYLEEEVLSDSSRAFKSWGVASRGLEGGHINELSFQPYVVKIEETSWFSVLQTAVNSVRDITADDPFVTEITLGTFKSIKEVMHGIRRHTDRRKVMEVKAGIMQRVHRTRHKLITENERRKMNASKKKLERD